MGHSRVRHIAVLVEIERKQHASPRTVVGDVEDFAVGADRQAIRLIGRGLKAGHRAVLADPEHPPEIELARL